MDRSPGVDGDGPGVASPPPPRPRGLGRVVALVAGVTAVGLVVLGVLVVGDLRRESIPPPTFASLQETPDPSLHGTLAYLSGSEKHPATEGRTGPGDAGTWCVRVVAAAGSPARNAYCIPVADLDGMVGPQLRWLPDDRLEVTMFGRSETGAVGPGWQRIVDVRTGAVEDVPAADVPVAPAVGDDTTVGPGGEQVSVTDDGGHVVVALATPDGSRTLLDASGNPSYGASVAGWSPDGAWLLLDDGRLLVVTLADPAVARVLVEDPAAYGDVDAAGVVPFAITGSDVLGSGS